MMARGPATLALALALLAAAPAHAAWRPPVSVSPPSVDATAFGLRLAPAGVQVVWGGVVGSNRMLHRKAIAGRATLTDDRPFHVALTRPRHLPQWARPFSAGGAWLLAARGEATLLRPGGGAPSTSYAVPNRIGGAHLAVNTRGDVLIPFVRRRGSRVRLEAVLRRRGARRWPAPRVLSAWLSDVSSPTGALDERGDAVVAFVTAKGVDVAATRRPFGDWGRPVSLAARRRPDSVLLSAAIAADGAAVVAWGEGQVTEFNTARGRALVARRPDAASPFGAAELLDDASATGGRAAGPCSAVAPGGSALAAWIGGDGNVQASRAAPGTAFGPAERLSEEALSGESRQWALSCALAADGAAHVAWSGFSGSGGPGLFVADAAPGAAFSAPVALARGPALNLSLVAAPGRAALAFRARLTADQDISTILVAQSP